MSHEQAVASIRAQLCKTSAMLGQVQTQHGEITKGVTARLKQVSGRLEQLRHKAIVDPDAADEYLELTKEKGALLRTLV